MSMLEPQCLSFYRISYYILYNIPRKICNLKFNVAFNKTNFNKQKPGKLTNFTLRIWFCNVKFECVREKNEINLLSGEMWYNI